jgi:exodeoxyribonuclease VII small subunit
VEGSEDWAAVNTLKTSKTATALIGETILWIVIEVIPLSRLPDIAGIQAYNKFTSIWRGKLHYNWIREFPLPKFEECLQRLEKIVQELEKGDAPLEKSLTLFEEGMQLSATCRKELEQAEGKVEILLKQNGKLQAVAFEPETEKISSRR